MNRKARIISMLLAVQMIIMSAATGVLALDDEMTISQDQAVTASEITVDETGSEGIVEDTEGTQTEDAAQAAEQAQIEQAGEVDASAVAEEGSVTVDATLSGTTATVTVSGDDAAQVDKIKTIKDGVESGAEAPDEGKLVVENLIVGSTYVFRAVDKNDAVLGQSAEIKVTGTLPAPKGIVAAPGHKSVTVYWDKVDGATGYEIYRNGKLLKKVGADKTSYRDKTVKEGPSGNTGKVNQYSYHVVAVSGSQHSEPSVTKKAGKVRTALYKITFKSSAKLTSHDKYKKTITFKGGQTVWADGFAQGKYQFWYKKGSKTYRFYSMWMRIKNPKGDIKKNAYENGYTAENYVNEGGYSSPTKWLIWVNLYSQRVYVDPDEPLEIGRAHV